MMCTNTTFATTTANVRTNHTGGRLTSSRLLSSLVIFPATNTVTGEYVCEGYVLP